MKSRDQSLNMHRFFIVAGIIAAYSMVILNTVSGGQADVVHICCYSTDPGSYEPKCYDCDAMVYKNALMACINMTELPKNISYKSANCLEKNCQIQVPKTSEAETMKVDPVIDMILKWFARPKRSLFDNNVEGSDISKNRHVVKEVSTFVSKDEQPTITFMDPEYM